ncbi:MAG: AsnC family transcriptional regulator [Proteobacteria bacterium ST_bin13]|jgi:Lrp/AsnC family transcriptional regulator|nr:MAG: AsnC family transcriptional regulator [Proteobacteria bacterium ST_bin13]
MTNLVTLDDLDRRIIHQLQRDASCSNAELADRVGSTGPSCWRRIRNLEDAGILTRTVRIIDPVRVGQGVNVICNIRIKSHSAEHTDVFEQFVGEQDRIMECLSMSGEWDYQVRVLAKDVADYEVFLMQTLLKHDTVAAASSHFALKVIKYKTAVPLPA